MSGGMHLAAGFYDVPAGKLAAVVTSLEMVQVQPARRRTQRPDLALRSVPNPRPDWYRDLFRRVGTPWLWSSRLMLSDEALEAIIGRRTVEVFALEHAGADQGLLELDFRVAGDCEIVFLGLAPALTGQGAGPWLMEQAIRRAWARPIRRLWVHTCTLDHPAALAFYVKSGFKPFRQQVEVADDPRRLGVVPADAAPHVLQG